LLPLLLFAAGRSKKKQVKEYTVNPSLKIYNQICRRMKKYGTSGKTLQPTLYLT
jgi:hypothetical protein